RELVDLYAADPAKVRVVHPGVDLEVFSPVDAVRTAQIRAGLGLSVRDRVLLFVGRIQPLKAPDVLLRVAAELLWRHPDWRDDLVVAVLGGPSGSGLARAGYLAALAGELGIADRVRFVPPVARPELADWYRAADLVLVPSHSESFGLVALEAEACGTPVVAAAVGGLPIAVGDSGVLVDGHETGPWTDAVHNLLLDPERRKTLSENAVRHAAHFGWSATTDRLLDVYAEARRTRTFTPMDAPATLVDVSQALVP
ncbi:MAG: glycosyltransferase, partial [Actinomycetota bacterium]|nr:glycosyltransferase [Actinomycetota bacterium]